MPIQRDYSRDIVGVVVGGTVAVVVGLRRCRYLEIPDISLYSQQVYSTIRDIRTDLKSYCRIW